MADWKIGDKSAVITPAITDLLPCVQSGVVKKITSEQILSLAEYSIDIVDLSWKSDDSTWTAGEANANFPTQWSIIIDGDATGYMVVGQKIKYTQTTIKYGIVVAVAAYTGSSTTITIWCGNNASNLMVTATAITAKAYATVYRPLDFPMGETDWSITYTNSTDHYKTSATVDTWYGGTNAWTSGANMSFYLGIGLWNIDIKLNLNAVLWIYFTLSTSSSAESDSNFTIAQYSSTERNITYDINKDKLLASVTNLYLIAKTSISSTDIYIKGDTYATSIVVKCLYL
jgi:hypothetical protein